MTLQVGCNLFWSLSQSSNQVITLKSPHMVNHWIEVHIMLTICLLGGTVVKLRKCAQEMSHVHMYISLLNIQHRS